MSRRWSSPPDCPLSPSAPVRVVRALRWCVGVSVACAPAAAAQLHVEAEVGGARVSQPDVPVLTAATMQAAARAERPWLAITAGGALTMPELGPVRVHALVDGTLRTAVQRPLGAELSVGGSIYDDGRYPAARASFVAGRLRAQRAGAFAWLGTGAGVLDDRVNRYPLWIVEAGGGVQRGRAGVLATAAHHATEGEPRIELPSVSDTVPVALRDRIAYTDLMLAPRYAGRRVEVEARGGVRLVHRTIAFTKRERQVFGRLDAAWWATPQLALVASTGRELADLARGLPASHYVTVAMRVRMRGASAGRSIPAQRPVVTGSAPDVLIEHRRARPVALRVLAGVAATQVEIAATFTAWEPVGLVADGSGGWFLDGTIPSGAHRLLVRVNGGPWMAPANLPALDDADIGVRVGLVTIP